MSSDKEQPCGRKPVAEKNRRQTALEAYRNWLQYPRSHIPLAAIFPSTLSLFVE